MRERLGIYCLGVAILYGTCVQGAFYRSQFQAVGSLVLLAVILRMAAIPRSRTFLLPAGGLLAFAAWAATSAWIGGHVADALPHVSLATCLLGALYVTHALSPRARDTILYVVVVAGLIVASTSWLGVVLHHQPWALLSQGLWRGASTITYANAAASALVVAIFVSVRFWLIRQSVAMFLVLYALGLGWIATLSRASGMSFALAAVLFVALIEHRRRLLRLWSLLPALVIAVAAMAPSLPEHDASHPWLALLGVGIGAATAVIGRAMTAPDASRIIRTLRWGTAAIGVVAVVAFGVAQQESVRNAIDRVVDTRLNVTSDDRSDLLRVTWQQLKGEPVTGVGPGQIDFEYVNHDGFLVRAEFTHNEYLQTAAETGFVGVGLLGVVLIGLALMTRRVWALSRSDASVAGAVLVAFAVHSGLDFLWHIPVLPLMALTVIGTLGTQRSDLTT